MPSSATIARRRLQKLAAVREATKTHPRPVDFHANASDFMVAMLFNIGMEAGAISEMTGLTPSQVQYRTMKVEREVRLKAHQAGKDFITARKAYRTGNSPVSKMVISQITGNRSLVKRYVEGVLDKRGLYAPQAKGVLRDTE